MTFLDTVIEAAIFFGSIILGGSIIVLVMWGGVTYLDCRGFSNGTGIETRWEWGCYANVDGKWMPKDYVYGNANEIRFKEKK